MKIPCTLKNASLIIRDRFGLSFASKGLSYLAALLLLLSLLARYVLSCYQTITLLTISALADITLLKTTSHFLLVIVGFDTLTYRKELQLIPYTCGSSRLSLRLPYMAKAKPGGGGASAGDAPGGGDGGPPEFYGSSNPSQAMPPPQYPKYAAARAFAQAVKANPTGSQHFASSFGRVV